MAMVCCVDAADPVYDRLKTRLSMALPIDRSWNAALHAGRGTYLRFGLGGLHPSRAFPDVGAPLTAVLLVVDKPSALVLRLETEWTTANGTFKSVGQYSASRSSGSVAVTAMWEKLLPSVITRSIATRTDGISLDDHYLEVTTCFLTSGMPIAQMLVDRHYPDVYPGIFAAAALEVECLLPSW